MNAAYREIAAGRAGEVGVQRVVRELHDMGLHYQDIAYVVGASVRSVSNWASGERATRRYEDGLMQLYAAASAWGPMSRPHVIGEWFRTPTQLLNDQRPLDVCKGGQFQRVRALIDAIQSGQSL